MNIKVQQHIRKHIQDVLDNWYPEPKRVPLNKIENDIVYKHLKLLVRWYAQIDDTGKDSYDYKKKDPLKVMSIFGMSYSLLKLFNLVYKYMDSPNSPELFSSLCNEYRLVECDTLIPKLSILLSSKNSLKRKEFNIILSPLVYYEHMTPSDVIVKQLLEDKSCQCIIPNHYYVLMIKKEQQLRLDSKDSKLKSKGTAQERLKYLNDRKISTIEILEFSKRINKL